MPILAAMNSAAVQTWRNQTASGAGPVTTWTQETTPNGIGPRYGGIGPFLSGNNNKFAYTTNNGLGWIVYSGILPTGLTGYDMDYDGTNYIVATTGGVYIVTSTTATIVPNGLAFFYNGVSYIYNGATKLGFVAVGNTYFTIYFGALPYQIITSPFINTNWQSVTYRSNPLLMVAVGQSGYIAYSTDTTGHTWNTVIIGSSQFESVTYTGGTSGIFVAVNDAGQIYTSTNGSTWTKQTSPTTTMLQDVAYGGAGARARLVAVGTNATIISSTNGGTTWITETAPSGLAGAAFITISYNGTYFVIGGQDNAGQQGIIVTGP